MEQQQAQRVEQQLRQNWQQIKYRILDQFAEVSSSDLDCARNVNDLVERIADRSRHSERFVETRLLELVAAGGAPTGGAPMGQAPTEQAPTEQAPTGQQEQPSGGQQGRPFGSSAQ
jgi:hypothetical protein